METTTKKVYDYKPELVRDKLVEALKRRGREATANDLVALTGLPKAQVQAELPAVSDEFGARLRVTESGEILYSFPSGFKSRYRGLGPALKRFWKAFKKGAAAVLSFLFKVWIVAMLVGYFVLFLAIALLATVASVAVSMSGRDERDNRRGGGIGGLWLTGRLLDLFIRIWFYSELFKDPYERAYERDLRAARRSSRRPLHKAIFSFVFGDGDPNADWESVEKRAVVAFLQANKGIMTLAEFMAISGLPPQQAEEKLSRYLYEFEGEPLVTEKGAIYYSFPGLLRRKDKEDRTYGGSLPLKRLEAFSSNPRKANTWFCIINGVNVLFGGYFLYEAIAVGGPGVYRGGFDYLYAFTHALVQASGISASPAPFLGTLLGAVPLAFSVLFYLVPALRARALARRNEAVKLENFRRLAYSQALLSPERLAPEALPETLDAARPADPRAADKILAELAAATGGEARAEGGYAFPELARAQAEAARVRASIREEDFALGGVAFDSHA